MKIGRDLDILVAESVMGEKVDRNRTSDGPSYFEPSAYSTDIAAAWKVVEKLIDNGRKTVGIFIEEQRTSVEVTSCRGIEHGYWEAESTTTPHAICLAALEVSGNKIE